MKKLAEKPIKIDLDLPKLTREILYEHILEVCEDLESKLKSEQQKATI